MILNLVLVAIISASLLAILIVIGRRLPRIAALQVSSLKNLREEKVKFTLIEERLERKLQHIGSRLKQFGEPLFSFLEKIRADMLHRIKKLELHYRGPKQAASREERELKRKNISSLLSEAMECMTREELPQAEKKCIEVISLDRSNVEAYDLLTKIYGLEKDWDKAIEVGKFIHKKLKPKDDSVVFEIAEAYSARGNMEEARTWLEKSAQMSPKNPKYLDELVSFYIEQKRKLSAKRALKKLSEVNPENQKIKEYEEALSKI